MDRWPLQKSWFWETAPFFRILLPFAAGIYLYDAALFAPGQPIPALLVLCALFSVTLLLFILSRSFHWPGFLLWPGISLLLTAAGYMLACAQDARTNADFLGRHLHPENKYLLRITANPEARENTWKIPATLLARSDGNSWLPVSGSALLYIYKDSLPVTLKDGDEIMAPGNWLPVRNAGNPFEFDYAAFCRRNNVYYQQFCAPGDVRLVKPGNPAHDWLRRSHDWSMAQLARYLPEPASCGLVQAMLLGDETNLDPALTRSYSETGIVHIIAISGGNITVLFAMLAYLLAWLRHRRHLWVKYAVALPLVWLYVLMAGAAPSALRAAAMFTLLALGITLGKRSNPLNQLFAAAFCLLCFKPMWLFSLGFQLSFVAVLSLVLYYAPISALWRPTKKWLSGLWATIVASLAAEVLVAPLVVAYFHIFPLLFLVANVAAWIFMSVVLILSIAILATSWWPLLANILGLVTTALVTFFNRMVVVLQGLNPPSFRFLYLSHAQLALVYIIIAGAAVFFIHRRKVAVFTAMTATCLMLATLCVDKWQSLRQRRLVVYNTRGTQVEWISGNHYHIILADTAQPDRILFITRPAHTAWHAWQQGDTVKNLFFTIGGKSALILTGQFDTFQSYPTDDLILRYPGKIVPRLIKKVFSPALVVLTNQQKPRQREHLREQFTQLGINVHSVQEDGAFVVEE